MEQKINRQIQTVCYGEILWDVLPDGPRPGGSSLNVAYHLTKLDIKNQICSSLGDDENGRALRQLMQEWKMDTGLLQQNLRQETSRVLAKLDASGEASYEILAPVAWDFIQPNEALTHAVGEADYLVYGSLASRHVQSRATLYELLNQPGETIKVFDINLRSPHFSTQVLEVLLQKADVAKFNEAELDMVQLMFRESFEGEKQKVNAIRERFGIPEVIVTKAEAGASYYKNNEEYHVGGDKVVVQDTIGSGDAFLAAFIASHSRDEVPLAILRNAIALGGFIATMKGGCPVYDLSGYQDFQKQLYH